MAEAKKSLLFFIFFLTFSLQISEGSVGAGAEKKAEGRQNTSSALSIRHDKGLFSVEADNVSLGTVLSELSRKGAAEFKISDAALSTDPLSVSFTDQPFPEAIARLLKNYSYVLEYRENDCPSVIILTLKGSNEGHIPQTALYIPVNDVVGEEKKIIVAAAPSEQPADPQGCEKPLLSTETFLTDATPYQPNFANEKRKAATDAIIGWAQRILAMKQCSSLLSEAVAALEGIQDGRVTMLLAGIAEKGGTAELRELATRALWKNTAKSEFMNIQGTTALTALSKSEDPGLSAVAQQAMSDYEAYMNRVNLGVDDLGDGQDISPNHSGSGSPVPFPGKPAIWN